MIVVLHAREAPLRLLRLRTHVRRVHRAEERVLQLLAGICPVRVPRQRKVQVAAPSRAQGRVMGVAQSAEAPIPLGLRGEDGLPFVVGGGQVALPACGAFGAVHLALCGWKPEELGQRPSPEASLAPFGPLLSLV